ncbi:PD-(D/E)XK nuclease family protein [Sorangium sp. So ce406]|uniref:PD-(D/E)XK nuclease family protein n=1 Tax=Sorangium sp. So ce406 TaxID=3133311 RepID=UPI003F5B7EB3
MLRVWEQELDRERFNIAALEAQWEAFIGRAFVGAAKFRDLHARLDLAREPGALSVTLLGPLGKERDERSHTRMLRALLDRSASGALAAKLLRALLGVVRGGGAELEVPAASLAEATIEIDPEWRVGPKPRFVYPDLVISVPLPEKRLVVVIENKIDARDHEGQLDAYREYAEQAFDDSEVMLVYLTPRGDEPDAADRAEPWKLMSYRELAVAWRRVLARETETSAWTEMLRLYLATILQGVLGERILVPPSRAVQARLLPYLEAALGE